ncbi:8901_t:CDS:10 [Acaulospora morrowiae]|uniref:8901_t:CDS:1 n=1 Tax=Acaulospora morrowiae TaxID=94023 RepID=A0A9N9D2A3_9GLOM|nr:8901_t:CDS:10 [Acaulospora morrowiae]
MKKFRVSSENQRRIYTTSIATNFRKSISSPRAITIIPNKIINRHNSIKSSTSAIEYKLTHPRAKVHPLPVIDVPTPSAEEAVTNILYNTPAPPPTPPQRHVLNCLVQNEPGVLSRVSGILAARGFNIDSLVVASTEVADLSRMTIVLRGHNDVIEQARRQLEDLAIWAVLDYTHTIIIERELLLIKLSILGPEHLHEQLTAIKREEYNDEFMPEIDLGSEPPDATSVLSEDPIIASNNLPLLPSAALRHKHAHLRALLDLSNLFGAKLVDVARDSVVIELTAKPSKLDAFVKLVKPFGILEATRSGMMALPRTPLFDRDDKPPEVEEQSGGVDATMLPPGSLSTNTPEDNCYDKRTPNGIIQEKNHLVKNSRSQKPNTPEAIVLHAVVGGLRSYALAHVIRGGVNFLLNVLTLFRKRRGTFRKAFVRGFFGKDAIRFGVAFGGFSFLWKLINNGLRHVRGIDDRWNGFIAGAIAGISLAAEKRERRITIAQQMFVRAVQAFYKCGGSRNYLRIPNIGPLLFIISTAQVMYAYTMQPYTLPPDFLHFMIKTARVSKETLDLNRNFVRGSPLKMEDALQILDKYKGTKHAYEVVSKLPPFPKIIPCELIHPQYDSCIYADLERFYQAFKGILPVYATLNFVPMMALKFRQFFKSPTALLHKGVFNTIRSSIFLATFVSSYLTQICIHRNIAKSVKMNLNTKYIYWITGVISSTAIFIENKGRRDDLSLYVVPKAAESLYKIMYQKNWIFELHSAADICFFSAAMGVIMTCFQHEPEVLSPMTKTILRKFFGNN